MSGDRKINKNCLGCGYRMRGVTPRCRFCKLCVREQAIARNQSPEHAQKVSRAQLERGDASFAALLDAELARPTRYWEVGS